ncbi:hypothetical protein SAMN04488058_105213 [Deinococcus reticulitermitis]|uniref:Lipoprotein n=1 Tax=Deinococcus reticulitermitis TaxID=856736 RepID=A0A1H6XHC6_9DEIO|nr:hypothetical protein [Deinococcus reticulitermitis]SEJ28521.1 hypothetical protein SAMN04488058_105213 [Deinococcus reticulitermitis]
MKTFASMLLALPLLLASCGNLNVGSSTQRPYTITVEQFGYEVQESGRIIVADSPIVLNSAAGAYDVATVSYTAVLLNSKGEPVGNDQSTVLPVTGTLFGKARGGYVCATTAASACSLASADAVFANTSDVQWPENRISRALMPGEWAILHQDAFQESFSGPVSGDSAGWYARFTFTATQSNGRQVTWQQNYPVVNPTK